MKLTRAGKPATRKHENQNAVLAVLSTLEAHLQRASADMLNSCDSDRYPNEAPESVATALMELTLAAEQLQTATTLTVDLAREVNVSWESIGKCMKVTKQGAQQRYNH
jgi:hypothetical protein